MTTTTDHVTPFACDMSALAPAVRSLHLATIQAVFQAVVAIQELPDGYAFRLPADGDTLRRAMEFIVNERLCCPFFDFAIEVGQEDEPAWLRLTGRDGIKPFIQAEIGGALRDSVAVAAGWR